MIHNLTVNFDDEQLKHSIAVPTDDENTPYNLAAAFEEIVRKAGTIPDIIVKELAARLGVII